MANYFPGEAEGFCSRSNTE